MWKQFTPEGILQYSNFLETVTQIIPMYVIRSIGGTMYFSGILILFYNIYKTMKQGTFTAQEEAQVPAAIPSPTGHDNGYVHRWIERKPMPFLVVTLVVILIGGLMELIPTFVIESNVPTIASVQPYTPLELEGRDLYIREGCYTCHSQMIRPFRSEVERYGEYSKAGEFVYDHPFLWGSKRTGPDLHRIGKKYPSAWHYHHMSDPRLVSPGSIMPPYPWLIENELDTRLSAGKVRAMMALGVPYAAGFEAEAESHLQMQAEAIAGELKEAGIDVLPNKEIIALIAYLQRLGTDIRTTGK